MGRSTSHDSRPRVILKCAMTLDGKIATRSGDSHISSKSDLNELHKLRTHVDAVMVGVGTLLADDPLLTARRARGKSPIRIVVDSLARTPRNSRVLLNKSVDTIVAVSQRAPPNRVSQLRQQGARVIPCGRTRVNLTRLLRKLHEMGIRTVLLEGGSTLNWSMLIGNLVDEISVTVAPFVVGGVRAKSLVEGRGVSRISDAIKLSLTNVTRNGNEIVLSYRARNN